MSTNIEPGNTQPDATWTSVQDILHEHQRTLEREQAERMQQGNTSAWPYNSAFPESGDLPAPPHANDDGSADDLLDAARLSDLHERLIYASTSGSNAQVLRGIMRGLGDVIASLERRGRQKIKRSHELREGLNGAGADWPQYVEATLRAQNAYGYSTTAGQMMPAAPTRRLDGEGKHKTAAWDERAGWHTITITGEGPSADIALTRAGESWVKVEEMLAAMGEIPMTPAQEARMMREWERPATNPAPAWKPEWDEA